MVLPQINEVFMDNPIGFAYFEEGKEVDLKYNENIGSEKIEYTVVRNRGY